MTHIHKIWRDIENELTDEGECINQNCLVNIVQNRLKWLKEENQKPNRNSNWDNLRIHLIGELENLLKQAGIENDS